jgi:tetratricopeptide (TPR) repeat protein
MKRTMLGLAVAALALCAGAPVWAQHDISAAQGKVLDREGQPIAGAVITFRPKSDPSKTYSATTNKKGVYSVSGLFTAVENDLWLVSVESEGHLPVAVRVESRSVSRVLLGAPMEVKLRGGKGVPEFPIAKMGSATVDFTLAAADAVLAEAQAATASPAEAEAVAGAGAAPGQGRDPWIEAVTLAGAGQLEESLPSFDEAIAEAPDDAERREAYAKILYKLERYDEALVQTQRALEIEPGRVTSHMVLYTIHVGRGDLERARATLEAARALAPRDVRVLEQLAWVAGQAGDKAAETAAWEAITTIDPAHPDAWLALGALYAEAKDSQRSEVAYQKVAELAPDEAYLAFYNRGALIMNRDGRSESDTRRAVEAFRRAVSIKPDYGVAYQQLGLALVELGDRPGAREALQTYLEISPDAPDAKLMRGLLASLQ